LESPAKVRQSDFVVERMDPVPSLRAAVLDFEDLLSVRLVHTDFMGIGTVPTLLATPIDGQHPLGQSQLPDHLTKLEGKRGEEGKF
jgi:hypothetical protein